MVTGGGRGIGKRLALGFATAGACVALVARSKVELDLAQLEIQHAGGSALRIRADVRNFAETESAVKRALAHFGQVDVLVCAAGVQGPIGPLHETDPDHWAAALHVNLAGLFHAARAVLPHMIGRRSGKIIALGGDGTMRARPFFSSYAAAKAATVRLVETLAEEVREYNIQVNCLGPGHTYTHMTDEILAAGEKAGWKDTEHAIRTRMTGGVSPQEQIQLALFLASERSNHISGKLIHVADDWRRLERSEMHPELYTLRRVRKV
ncbi:MAG: SDR family oxidoreductase [Bryobacteraceae bacterium]|nr:SDR family oxidoreductase [Bryobacteraceae bacterium]